MNLCLSYHVKWTVLHAWLHYGISTETIHFGHCLKTREVRCKKRSTWIGGRPTFTYFNVNSPKNVSPHQKKMALLQKWKTRK